MRNLFNVIYTDAAEPSANRNYTLTTRIFTGMFPGLEAFWKRAVPGDTLKMVLGTEVWTITVN